MRRVDREVTERSELLGILKGCRVCHIGMTEGNRPYVIPMNFGAEWEENGVVIYLHCAREGKKLEILRGNPNVCFEADCSHNLIEANKACGYGYEFSSVIGSGRVEILEDPTEKAHGLSCLMFHQTGKHFSFTDTETDSVSVLKIKLEDFSGKRHTG